MKIDLHLHTTASDGRCSPTELVARAAVAGVTVMAVTDHDTMAGVAEAQAAARMHAIDVVPGIEITAVEQGRDVHVLGYFLDATDPDLSRFLNSQRESRCARVEAMAARLAEAGKPVDIAPVLDLARHTTRSIGRPQVARAIVAAGYAETLEQAFERYLSVGGIAHVPRTGVGPEQVISMIQAAGGLASLAHPHRSRIDARIAPLSEAGLDALEAFHAEHDAVLAARYVSMAHTLGLLVTGGSDFHGDASHGPMPGDAGPPPHEWSRVDGARDRHARH